MNLLVHPWLYLIVIVAILALAAMFTLLEYSVVKVRPSELQELKQTGTVKKARHMVGNLNEYLSTAQVGVTMTSLILGWIGDEYITELLERIPGIPHNVLMPISPVIGILIFTFVHAVFTDLVPKNIAIDQPVKILLRISHPISFFHTVFYPFVWLFAVAAEFFTKLLGYSAHPEEDTYTQNEIVTLSRQAEKTGEMDRDDVLFMRRGFEMNDKVAADIMVDRTQLTVINNKASIADAANLYFKKRFTRVPVVVDNDKDHILGYIFSYDVLEQNQRDGKKSIKGIIRQLPSVYESDSLTDVMKKMTAKQVPMVVVRDEYGGTSGIITDKDIYEEMFGKIREEIDHDDVDMIEKEEVDSRGNQTYIVSGKMPLSDFEREFKTKVPQFEDSDVATLTGYFLEGDYHLKVNRPIRVGGFSFIPQDLSNSYVSHFKVVRIKDVEKDQAESKEDAAETDEAEEKTTEKQ